MADGISMYFLHSQGLAALAKVGLVRQEKTGCVIDKVWLIDLQGEKLLMWCACLRRSCTIEAPGTVQREYFIVSSVKTEWVAFTCVISVTDFGGRD